MTDLASRTKAPSDVGKWFFARMMDMPGFMVQFSTLVQVSNLTPTVACARYPLLARMCRRTATCGAPVVPSTFIHYLLHAWSKCLHRLLVCSWEQSHFHEWLRNAVHSCVAAHSCAVAFLCQPKPLRSMCAKNKHVAGGLPAKRAGYASAGQGDRATG